jgi:hypothetical protein
MVGALDEKATAYDLTLSTTVLLLPRSGSSASQTTQV